MYNYAFIEERLHMYTIPAEWQKQRSIMFVFPSNHKDWQHSIIAIAQSYARLINAVRKFQKCVIICSNKSVLDAYFDTFTNIEIYEIQTDDTWIRDFGAIEFFADKKLQAYNFVFNAWGDKFGSTLDNTCNQTLQNLGFFPNKLRDVDFVLEGGSIDSNGEGVLLSTARCIYNPNRNPQLTPQQIDAKIKSLFGLEQLIVLKNGALYGDDTDAHVDTLARFITKDTIAYVKCYDTNDAHFQELAKMEQELQKTGFRLVALPLPGKKVFKNRRLPATYINFIFINNAIIVPTYQDKYDKIAIEIFKTELPDREVIAIDASIFIRENGSLHCGSINQYEGLK